MKAVKRAVAIALLMMPGFLCFEPADARTDKLEIFVSILPQAYFVERIGQPMVNVHVLVGPGLSPHTYEPTPRQMADLGRASLYFRIGSLFEQELLRKIEDKFGDLVIVDMRKEVPLLFLQNDRHEGHGHGGHRHDAGFDPHIWLDPKRVRIQAATICEALIAMDGTHADLFRENLRRFDEDLAAIDEKISKALAPLKGRAIYVFHPAFGYFADSYGLRQVAIEIDGKEPSTRQLAAVIQRARNDGVRIIFVQPQFATRYAETMAREIGGAVIPLDPLDRDYLANLEFIAATIRKAVMNDIEEGSS